MSIAPATSSAPTRPKPQTPYNAWTSSSAIFGTAFAPFTFLSTYLVVDRRHLVSFAGYCLLTGLTLLLLLHKAPRFWCTGASSRRSLRPGDLSDSSSLADSPVIDR